MSDGAPTAVPPAPPTPPIPLTPLTPQTPLDNAGAPPPGGAERLQTFVDMSTVLSGFQIAAVLGLDPQGISQGYLDEADRRAGTSQVDALLAEFSALQGQPPQQVADVLLAVESATPPPGALLARSVVKMWYLGSWYAPASVSANADSVVSSNAYTNGLAWRAMQAHPMGYSELNFGYWSTPPPPLADFGVGDGSGTGTGGNHG
jgi:hypothetical protein